MGDDLFKDENEMRKGFQSLWPNEPIRKRLRPGLRTKVDQVMDYIVSSDKILWRFGDDATQREVMEIEQVMSSMNEKFGDEMFLQWIPGVLDTVYVTPLEYDQDIADQISEVIDDFVSTFKGDDIAFNAFHDFFEKARKWAKKMRFKSHIHTDEEHYLKAVFTCGKTSKNMIGNG